MQQAKRKSSYKTAKAKAWKAFSQYIRTRDCLETTGQTYIGKCFTCDGLFEFSRLHAGHFIDGRMNSILFHEQCVHAQCIQCNKYKQGNKVAYARKMQWVYGKKVIDKLYHLSKQIVKFSEVQLLEMAEEYKRKTEELKINGPTT